MHGLTPSSSFIVPSEGKQAMCNTDEPVPLKASTATGPGAPGFHNIEPKRRPMVYVSSTKEAGYLQTIAVMIFAHFCVTALCLNVAFDLFVLGLPGYALLLIPKYGLRMFRSYMTMLTNYTTPIVFNLPMIISGTKLHCDSMDFYENKVKSTNSLMLANHGSRIDWMIGMYVGYINKPVRVRVGFVCERVIQYMPLIGWYRKIVCEDVFVDRSFKIDKVNISQNLNDFHDTETERMLYLSPEGVVVDYGERDQKYMRDCREFCKSFGMEPFDYVLTPRYKGQTVLVEHVKKGGTIVSICTAFVRDGKLLNCEMLSDERVIPDIYTLCTGIGGKPVHIYINLEELHFDADSDIKTIMMKDYERKNTLLKEWHNMLKAGRYTEFEKRFDRFVPDFWGAQLCQILHGLAIYAMTNILGIWNFYLKMAGLVFILISCSHTMGWLLNQTSMESVPFETAIKAVLMRVSKKHAKHKDSSVKKRD